MILLSLVLTAPGRGQTPSALVPSEKECEEFARKLESELANRQTTLLGKSLDADDLLDRSLKDLPGNDAFKEGVRAGIKKRFPDNILSSLEQGVESYKFLRVRRINDQPEILFRLLTTGGGLNYLRFVPARCPRRGIKLVDIHVLITGEYLSQTFRRLFMVALAQQEKTWIERLVGDQQDLVKHMDKAVQMATLNRQGQQAKALEVYRTLPATLQKEKVFLLQRMAAAGAVDEKDYAAAIELWQKTFPNDPSLELILIDGYAMKQQYQKVVETVDHLGETLGGDPYLDVLAGNQHYLLKDPVRATERARRAIQAEPTLAAAYDLLLTLSLDAKNFAEIVRLAEEFERTFGVSMYQSIQGEAAYAEFLKSQEGQNWSKAQRAATLASPPADAPAPVPPSP